MSVKILIFSLGLGIKSFTVSCDKLYQWEHSVSRNLYSCGISYSKKSMYTLDDNLSRLTYLSTNFQLFYNGDGENWSQFFTSYFVIIK